MLTAKDLMTFGNLLKLTNIYFNFHMQTGYFSYQAPTTYILFTDKDRIPKTSMTCAPSYSSDLDQKGQITSDQGLTSAESPLYGCLKLTMSTARYFLTRARSACLAPSSSEWPLYSTEYKQNRMCQMITTEYKQNRMHQMITTNSVQTK